MDINEIAQKVKRGHDVTPEEFAALVTNDKEALFSFMIQNNPGSMNNVLRNQLGYTHELGYRPDPMAMGRVIQMIMEKGDENEINKILNNFMFNLNKIGPKLLGAITKNKNS